MLSCLGCVGVLAWIGIYGPDTAVYAGNSVPQRFILTMRDLGALDEDEQILYFYSDALSDIREGFCFVSDRKAAVYSRDVEPPLTVMHFDEIADVTLYRDDSFLVDSEIIVELNDGRPVSLSVSSETDGDVRFFEALRSRVVPAADE